MRYRTPVVVFVAALAAAALSRPGILSAQEAAIDLNTYYRYPLSMGFRYDSLSPLQSYNTDYNIFELAVELRRPLASLPVIQPFLQTGLIQFDSLDPVFPEKWDHRHWFGALGLAYVHRFARNFEVGADLLAGASQAVFPQVVDTGPVGSPYLLFGAGGKITLVPSYSLGIEIQPRFKYLRSLSPLKELDGFLFGLGFSVHYRFGEDPDSARALIRSLRFDSVSLPALFGAMQSYYVRNPIGSVRITNTEKHAVTDLEISFFQNEFMDSATVAGSVPALGPGESVEVPLFASFNQRVFTTEGVTPLTGEIVVSYRSRGRAAEQRQPVSYDLYDKTAITWDDDRKVGAFITPADSALRNYASFVRQTVKDQSAARFNEPLQFAMQVYGALAELGVIYQADPSSPFTQVQGNTLLVDSVSLPRDTLRRITGDCDDLTVLFCSLLETVGIETGFITVPGHIYPAINTGEQTRNYRDLHPDRAMTIDVDGQLWVPLEITLVGDSGFLEAWTRGAELWNAYRSEAEQRRFYGTRAAQSVYRPVGLRETDLGLQYGNPQSIAASFARDLARVAGAITDSYAAEARRSGRKQDYNRLGTAHVRFGNYKDGEAAFNRALQQDPSYLAALVNLGNIRYLSRDYPGALRLYENARGLLAAQGREDSAAAQMILLNVSQVHHAMANYSEAREYFVQAEELGAERVREYAFLGRAGGGTERASEAGARPEVLFLSEE